MSDNCKIKYKYKGETEGTYIWTDDDEEISNLYIHKWRVPTPAPLEITVWINKALSISGNTYKSNKVDFINNANLRMTPIECYVTKLSSHTFTTRYSYNTDVKDIPFEDIYIPNSSKLVIYDDLLIRIEFKR